MPGETRQHLREGLTDFERILPGADRMYPDTDHPPIKFTKERVEAIRKKLPEPTWEVEARFRKHGLPEDTIKDLALSKRIGLIDELAKRKFDMKLVGRLLGQTARSLKRQGVDADSIPNGKWKKLIESCAEKKTQAKEFEKLVRTQVSPQ